MLIGRNAGNRVIIDHESVAPIHAVIQFKPNMTEPCLSDKGTKAGTFLQGNKIDMEANPDGVLLQHGDVVQFGRCEKKYKFVDKKEEARKVAAV